MKIAVLNQSSVVTNHDAQRITTALRYQMSALSAAWERHAAFIAYYTDLAAVPTDRCLIAILDDADIANALGYHDVTPDGRPYSKVFAKTVLKYGGTIVEGADSVSACASHEMCEMFVDPGAQLWATYDAHGAQIALEACDPCQNAAYTSPNGVSLSDYVLPAYFNPFDLKGPYDHLGVLTKPAPALAKGGYAIVENSNGIRQIFGDLGPRRDDKLVGVSRTALRLGPPI